MANVDINAMNTQPLLPKKRANESGQEEMALLTATGIAVVNADGTSGTCETEDTGGMEEGLLLAGEPNDQADGNKKREIDDIDCKCLVGNANALTRFPYHKTSLLCMINAFLCQFASFFGQQFSMYLMSDVAGVDPTATLSRIVLVFLWTIIVFSEFALLRSVLLDALLFLSSSVNAAGSGEKRRVRHAEAEAYVDRAFVVGSLGGSGLVLTVLQLWSKGPITAEMCVAWAFTLTGLVAFGCFPSFFLRD